MIIIFQVMIQQKWSDIMYYVWDSFSFWSWPYFILLNLVGPMFAIQLFLVVVANKYADAKQKQAEAENAAVSLYEVKVGIVTANLPRGKANVSVDPYVKLQVGDKIKKTRILKNTSVPEWNEYFVFPVSSVSSRCTITMYKWQRTGPHEVLGALTVAVGTLDEVEEGTDKWYELVVPDGSAQDGSLLHVRTQWRRGDTDEWAPLPEVIACVVCMCACVHVLRSCVVVCRIAHVRRCIYTGLRCRKRWLVFSHTSACGCVFILRGLSNRTRVSDVYT
jgi:hypothetical protein